MPICEGCGSKRLRLSHYRFKDISKALVLHFPVRCQLCRMRSYVPIASAIQIRREHRARRAPEQPPHP